MQHQNLFVTINKKKYQVSISYLKKIKKFTIAIRDGQKSIRKPDFAKTLTFNSKKEALDEFVSWKNTEIVDKNIRYVRTDFGVFRLNIVSSKNDYGQRYYSCRLVDRNCIVQNKPKHFPKLHAKSLDELLIIISRLPGYFEGKRGLVDIIGQDNVLQKEQKIE